MRTVHTRTPSFPNVTLDEPFEIVTNTTWQVLCGDDQHYRIGIYSPQATRADELRELEKHDCPEFFMLLSGRLTLLLRTPKGLRELELQPFRPVFVKAPHSGFCPDGPHQGRAIVVERDSFDTEYRDLDEWNP